MKAIELVKIALNHTCLNCYANTSRDIKSNYLTCPNGCPSGSFFKQGAEGDQWRVVDALRLYYLLKLGLQYDECTTPRFIYRNYGANKASLTCKNCNRSTNRIYITDDTHFDLIGSQSFAGQGARDYTF